MTPVIGMLGAVDAEKTSSVLYPYARAIEAAGGVPVLLPYVSEVHTLQCYLDICQGFLLTGGVDLDPACYGEKLHPACGEIQPYRDELELRFIRMLLQTNKPILGICRGAQLINVALGGTLYQDIPSQLKTLVQHRQSEPRFSLSHSVEIVPQTPLHQLTGQVRMCANSFHHQAIKTTGQGLCPMAFADDGIIEAVYLAGERYLRAYQWHPERIREIDADNHRIFTDFIAAVKGESK